MTKNVISLDKVDITSLRKKLKGFDAILDDELIKALYALGEKIKADAVASLLGGNKSGRIYRRGHVEHRASAPGEDPASDTGRLAQSLAVHTNEAKKTVEIKAGGGSTSVGYAAYLEFGTKHILPRPYMRPAYKKNEKNIIKAANQAAKKAMARIEAMK